jgi:hypothetical protein
MIVRRQSVEEKKGKARELGVEREKEATGSRRSDEPYPKGEKQKANRNRLEFKH